MRASFRTLPEDPKWRFLSVIWTYKQKIEHALFGGG